MKYKNMITYTITVIDIDDDGYTTATLLPGGGVITDHPYWENRDGSHYVAGLSGMKVGDSVTI